VAIRQLPTHPSLKSLRHQAKQLLKAQRSGAAPACERLRVSHPELSDQSLDAIRGASLSLSDAQLTVAREYDFASWAKLIASIPSADLNHMKGLVHLHHEFVMRLSGMLSFQPELMSAYRMGDPVVDVDVVDHDLISVEDYLRLRPKRCCSYSFTLAPMRGPAFIEIPHALTDLLMPDATGLRVGDPESASESQLIESMLNQIVSAWAPFFATKKEDCSWKRSSSVPTELGVSVGEVVYLKVEINSTRHRSVFFMCYGLASLEPMLSKLHALGSSIE
jgi:hypothetical protein